MYRGYIKEYRKITEWEWYTDINVCHLFRHCLYKANIEDKSWRGQIIKRGSFVTSLGNLAKETGLSIQNVRTSLNKLKLTHELTHKTTNRYSIITVIHYDLYQETNTQSNNLLTNNQQTTNKQLTTTKEYKNEKNEKNISFSLLNEENEKTKKEDPLTSKSTLFFISEYKNIFGNKPFLSFKDKVRLCELSAEYPNFKEIIPTALSRLKAIEFKDIDFKPTASWLLKDNNFERVMNGEFEKQNNVDEILKAWVKKGENNGC